MSTVALVPCAGYEEDEVMKAVSQAFSLAPPPPLEGKTILLKPNILSDAPPGRAITTHPMVVRAVARALRSRGVAKILVGESPAMQTGSFSPVQCGMDRVCREEGLLWTDLTKDTRETEVPYTHGLSLPFSRVLDEVDAIITLPKMKTHRLMYATGALKNQFGLVPGLHKSMCHVKRQSREGFADLICGINRLHIPCYALMDGIVAMEGEGPANGNPRFVGRLIAGSDLCAVDWVEAVLMGYDPHSLPILSRALLHGLGEGEPQCLPQEASPISGFRTIPVGNRQGLFGAIILPKLTRLLPRRNRRPVPRFVSERCVHCLRCVRICPGKALTTDGKTIVMDERRCVRCYCCHEVCPAGAIDIKERP